MASVKLILDQRAPRKDGTCPVKLGVSHKGYFQISLGIHVLPENWIDGMIVFPASQSAKAKQLNEYLQGRLGYAQSTLRRLMMLGDMQSLSNKELRRCLDPNAKEEKEPAAILVSDQFNSFIDRRNKPGTANIYRETLAKISKYHDLDKLKFEDITVAWLKDFENKLRRDGLAVNSTAIHLRNIRAVYNDAIDYEVVGLAAYPFRRFKITHEATAKRSLTLDQLRQLRDYPCETHQEKYRDLFMLIFYLGGINLVDLLRVKEITNGRIEYRRAKTSTLYSIKVEPEAQEIIDKYRGEKQLLDPLDRYSNYKDFLHRMNKNLQEIGTTEIVARSNGRLGKKEKTGLFAGLSSYWARHTMATLMAEIDIPMDTIARVLGHSTGKSVTAIYVKFDQRKIDDAMRRVIDYVNGNKENSRILTEAAAETKKR